jgi:hypothetical protein
MPTQTGNECVKISNNAINILNESFASQGLENPGIYFSSLSACEIVCDNQPKFVCRELADDYNICIPFNEEIETQDSPIYNNPNCDGVCSETLENAIRMLIYIRWRDIGTAYRDLDTSVLFNPTGLPVQQKGYGCPDNFNTTENFRWITGDYTGVAGSENFYLEYEGNIENFNFSLRAGWFVPANIGLQGGKDFEVLIYKAIYGDFELVPDSFLFKNFDLTAEGCATNEIISCKGGVLTKEI